MNQAFVKKYSNYYVPILILITVLVYFKALFNGFSGYDDTDIIIHNPLLQQLSWESIKTIFTTFKGTDFPLTLLSYTIEHRFFGFNPFYFHLFNIVLHVSNSVLVYILIKKISNNFFVAAFCSLFFAIHPMHVESVAWISERKDVLYAFFFLLSLISYTGYLQNNKKWQYLFRTLIWFILSLLSKPSAVILPFVLIIMDYYINKEFSLKSILFKVPFLLVSVWFGFIAIAAQKSVGVISNLSIDFSIFDRIMFFSYSIIYYVVKLFLPIHLSVIHFFPHKTGMFLPLEYYISFPVLLFFIWGMYKIKQYRDILLFGMLFYVITLAMVIQIIPFGQALVAERFTYIPYIGILYSIGMLFSREYQRLVSVTYKYILWGILFCCIFLCITTTVYRILVWQNGNTLFTDLISKYPQEGYCWFARGNYYYENKKYKEALFDYNKSIDLKISNPDAFVNRGLIYLDYKNTLAAKHDFIMALHFDKKNYKAYNNLGILYNSLQQIDSSIINFNKAIFYNSNYAEAYKNRGNMYAITGNYSIAIDDFTKAIVLQDNFAEAFNSRGTCFRNLKKYDVAINDYSKALDFESNNPEYWYDRGTTYLLSGKFKDAISDFSTSINLKSNYIDAYCNRGAAYAYLNKMDESLKDFNSAITINPKYADAYFSRGFTKLSLKDTKGACSDWHIALSLGNAMATEAIAKYCKN